MRFGKLGLAIGLVVVLSSSAHAAIINVSSATGFFPAGQSQIKIENYENIAVDVNGNGVLDIGDTLRGIVRVTSSQQGADQYQPDGSFELTGIFETQVIGFTDFGATSAIQFGPYAGFASDLAAITGQPVGDFAGAMIALFEDGTPDWLTDITSVGAAEADATDGTLFAVLGSTGVWGTDYYWGADGPRLLAANATVSTNFASSLELLINNTGLEFGDNINQLPTTLVGISYGLGLGAILNEFGLKGSIKLSQATAGDPSSIYALRSDDPITVNVITPEPASMLVWSGLSIVGFGLAAARKRRSAAKTA